MGLVPTLEHNWAGDSIIAAEQMAIQYLDLDALALVAAEAPPVPICENLPENGIRRQTSIKNKQHPRIGIFKDSAFLAKLRMTDACQASKWDRIKSLIFS